MNSERLYCSNFPCKWEGTESETTNRFCPKCKSPIPWYPEVTDQLTIVNDLVRSKHIISGSDGVSLHFPTKELYDAFKHEELILKLTYYATIRNKFGIWAGTKDTFVEHASELSGWDGLEMERLLKLHKDEIPVVLVDRGFITEEQNK